MKPLTLSMIQTSLLWEDKPGNLAALSLKMEGVPAATQVILLPELFATAFSMHPGLAEDMDGTVVSWMREQANKLGKIVAGSVMIRENGNLYNRLVWMLPNGAAYHYDKRHLFAFGNEDKVFTAGEKRLIVQVNRWKIALMICYDLRFPVWSRQQGAPYDLLIYVANWPEKRNHAWKTLLRARAIENQCYVAAVNRVGADGHNIAHSGDSVFIDPLGQLIHTLSAEEGILTHTFHKEQLTDVRQHFPFLSDADRFMIVD